MIRRSRSLRLLAFALGLAAFPVFASYSFTDGEIAGHFGSTYSTPLTICAYIKFADHPASNESAVNFGSSPSSATDSMYVGVSSTADEYREESNDSSTVYDAAIYAASTGEYDGVWLPICIVENSTDRDVYVESTSNHGTDGTNHTFNDVFDEISIGRRLDNNQSWTGLIAEVCVYNGTMSGADMTSYMTGTACNSLSGAANVIGYYSLSTDNTGTGMDADESGNGGPTLTEAGTLAYSADHPTITGSSSPSTLLLRRHQQ